MARTCVKGAVCVRPRPLSTPPVTGIKDMDSMCARARVCAEPIRSQCHPRITREGIMAEMWTRGGVARASRVDISLEGLATAPLGEWEEEEIGKEGITPAMAHPAPSPRPRRSLMTSTGSKGILSSSPRTECGLGCRVIISLQLGECTSRKKMPVG